MLKEVDSMRIFEECGCCGCYHPEGFYGDCRDDANRYGPGDLMKLGEEGVGWSVIPLDLTDEQGRKEIP